MAARDWLCDVTKGVVRSVRPAQVEMAEAVERTIADGGLSVIEAGTGVGKSFGYLIPAIESGKRVVISTAKKALQTQLIEKDLPHLCSQIKAVPYALLKGKNNYACGLRIDELVATDPFRRLPDSEQRRFLQWFDTSETADLAELAPPFLYEGGARVTECVRRSCPHAESDCGYIDVRDRAMAAQILVVNHALLAFDLRIGGGKLLGPYDALVIDEAHQAPKYFREAYSLKLHHKQPETIRRVFHGTEFEVHEVLDRIYGGIFSKLPPRNERLVLDAELRQLFGDLLGSLDQTYLKLKGRGLINEDGGEITDDQTLGTDLARARARLRSGAELITKARELCRIALGRHIVRDEEGNILSGDEIEYVVYVEKARRGEMPEVVVTPVEVGPLVAPALLHVGRVVITSATLATSRAKAGGTGLEHMTREFGLSPAQLSEAKILPSPFDYPNRAVLYVSDTTPDPSADRGGAYYHKMAEEIHELLEASKGGALILCTSYEDMTHFYETIRERFSPLPYVLGQQTGAPEALIEWFKKTPTAALFAVKTFWEGVDIPGLGLRLVIIPRLPFPNPKDVVLTARKQKKIDRLVEELGYDRNRAGGAVWKDYDFQESIIDLKQGAGRLLRSENDWGAVAILDQRVSKTSTKGYKNEILSSLPPFRRPKNGKADTLALLRQLATAAVPSVTA